ncbi:DUF4148 domain-containing protein [Paraburkholderia sp. LEh10]|uniref:DUF4148 domain-containing protein n=1 Tax=Paraburkholderia sp. LEh10 TaxID=2821353 RepID=UPI001AE7CCA5|nr:DUF4148 domain-containing protein [Paraburkholderia sp. LEh10]MBP0589491.1 DUF4148 domain-containing protein [Paraburkholderia sp. LEh10]
MQVRKVMAILLLSSTSIGFIGTAQAQGKTREQVRQELIDAEQNGSMYVTDASYPDVNAIYQHLLDQKNAAHANDSAIGPDVNGSTETGRSAAHDSRPMSDGPSHDDGCVGPISFCEIYFGGS